MEKEPKNFEVNVENSEAEVKPEVIIDEKRGEVSIIIDASDPEVKFENDVVSIDVDGSVIARLSNGKVLRTQAISVPIDREAARITNVNGQIEIIVPIKGKTEKIEGLEIKDNGKDFKPDIIVDEEQGKIFVTIDAADEKVERISASIDDGFLFIKLHPMESVIEVPLPVKPEEIEPEDATATVRNGQLEVVVPLKRRQ